MEREVRLLGVERLARASWCLQMRTVGGVQGSFVVDAARRQYFGTKARAAVILRTAGTRVDLVLTINSLKIAESGARVWSTLGKVPVSTGLCSKPLFKRSSRNSHRARRPHVAPLTGAAIHDGSSRWRLV